VATCSEAEALSAASLTAENLGSFRKERRWFLPLRLWRLPKAYTGSATVVVDELHAGGGVLACRCLQKGTRLGSFRKTSPPVLTASALSASEAERLVRHRSFPDSKKHSREDRVSTFTGKSVRDRRSFIGGSDARIIMGDDETALVRLWREKRGEVEPEDLADNLIVQLGTVTEHLNRHWYERNTGQVVTEVQRQVFHPVKRWMAATLDGTVEGTGAVFEAKFMLPWTFSEEGAAEKHMAQLQHNMWVTASRTAVLSIITGGGKWVEMTIPADPLYQHLLLTAERKFWRCVQSGEPPHLFGIEPPRPRVEAVRTVDMSGSNAWAEFANLYRLTRPAAFDHDRAKTELKALVPEDAREAAGHGVRAKRSKSGAISFEVLELEASHAALQR
jgi:predicted phage-related endonuclease